MFEIFGSGEPIEPSNSNDLYLCNCRHCLGLEANFEDGCMKNWPTRPGPGLDTLLRGPMGGAESDDNFTRLTDRDGFA